MRNVPDSDRDQYRALVYARVLDGRVGVLGGIGTLYLQERLLREFGAPLSNERPLPDVLYAEARGYDLIVGLPIGADDPPKPGDRVSARRVYVLYPDGRFIDHREFPSTYPPTVLERMVEVAGHFSLSKALSTAFVLFVVVWAFASNRFAETSQRARCSGFR